MRIAMWSGPRNLSTAMMYSFGARSDFAVWDEPFYAPYLAISGSNHPMREEIIEHHESNPNRVAQRCIGAIPDDRPHFYMKHMPHHMLDGFSLNWAKSCVNIHLIRHPVRVIASYGAKRDEVSLDAIGFAQQARIYGELGGVVVDSSDIRENPEGMLRKLCDVIDLPFDAAMLSWPTGGIAADGVWAKHWYGAIHRSSGFSGKEGKMPVLEPELDAIALAAMPHYEDMAEFKLTL